MSSDRPRPPEGANQRALFAGERTFRALLEAAPDAMLVVDQAGRIVLVNGQTETLFGYDRSELLGEPVEQLIPASLRGRHHAHRQTFAAAPRPRMMGEGLDLLALRKDGTTFPVDIALGPVTSEEGTFVSAAIRDVTERKRTERAMRDFLATLGHELRNPMAAISNATRLLRHPGVSPDQARWSQQVLEDEGRHMTRLIDDLLDLSRVARNTIELQRERVDFARIVDRMLDSTRALLEQRAHQISVSLPRGPLLLDADPVRLTQVLMNLVDNAAKYMPHGGRIEVEGRVEGGYLYVSVRDHGMGIGPDALPRLFDMFYRGNRSLEQQAGGLGIGLTLVSQLVALHGGTIEVASEGPDRGSVFTIGLPMTKVEAADGDRGAAAPDDATAATAVLVRVLVADDNRSAADSLTLLLRLDGHEVETVYDGPSAIAMAETFRPRVVLLDIGMPGQNGYDVAREMRARWGGRMYLVALTGLGTPEDRDRALAVGFDTHLVKPVDVDALETLISAHAAHTG